jgi:hypothetical protein
MGVSMVAAASTAGMGMAGAVLAAMGMAVAVVAAMEMAATVVTTASTVGGWMDASIVGAQSEDRIWD